MTHKSIMLMAIVVISMSRYVGAQGNHIENKKNNSIQSAIDTDSLKNTIVTPLLDIKICPGKNIVWCATFQMAWDKFKKYMDGEIKTIPSSDVVQQLNKFTLDKNDLPQNNIICEAGFLDEGIIDTIQNKLKKVSKRKNSHILNETNHLSNNSYIIYAYLSKALTFPKPFAQLDSVVFNDGNTKVKYFGIDSYSSSSKKKRELGKQIRIVWHRFIVKDNLPISQEYIVELLVKSSKDRLILAKIHPRNTFGKTIEYVIKRIHTQNTDVCVGMPKELILLEKMKESKKDNPSKNEFKSIYNSMSKYSNLLVDECITVPQISFNIKKRYNSLIGLKAIINKKKEAIPIIEAQQQIRFNLNEEGVKLDSEAVVGLFGDMAIRNFTFSEPFLLILMRKNSKYPYFALWVNDNELLVKNTNIVKPDKHEARDLNVLKKK